MEEQKIYVCMPAKVVTDLVAYLETKPYSDVAKLISEVARSAKDCTQQVAHLYEPPKSPEPQQQEAPLLRKVEVEQD